MSCEHHAVADRSPGRRHGLISLCLMAFALALAFIVLAAAAPVAAVCYMMVLSGGSLIVLWRFCARCPCRGADCRHVLPGLLVQRLTQRPPGPYPRRDIFLTTLALTAMLGFPQPWLRHHGGAIVFFWLLVLAALVEILGHVCPACRNRFCPVRRVRRGASCRRRPEHPANPA